MAHIDLGEKASDYFHTALCRWKEIRWLIVFHQLKCWGWELVSKPLISIVIFGIMAEGWRLLVPPLGQKLHRMPFLGFLKEYEETHDLDIAVLFTVGMIVAVWVLWHNVIDIILRLDTIKEFSPSEVFVLILAGVVLCADAFVFGAGISERNWGGGFLNLSAIVATAAYICILIFSCWVALNLRMSLQNAKETCT